MSTLTPRQEQSYRLGVSARRRAVERELAPRHLPRTLARSWRGRFGGADRPGFEEELLAEFGPVTEAERALGARIDRENALMGRALATVRDDFSGPYLLHQFVLRRYATDFIKELSEAQLDDLEAWVARREARKAGGRS
jgi:hypothetical protein